jgi:plasmid maintenance system antidote protein VapI
MRIHKIVRGERGISAVSALRLACYFGMSVEFWTGIQTHYEVERCETSGDKIAPTSARIAGHCKRVLSATASAQPDACKRGCSRSASRA